MNTHRTVIISFQSRDQSLTITQAEHNLLLSHPDTDAAATFVRQQYMLPPNVAEAVVEAIKANTITRLPDRKVEVQYAGEESSQELTYAEYNILPNLTTIQATKFIKDQYSLGLYEAKRCADAARAQHAKFKNL